MNKTNFLITLSAGVIISTCTQAEEAHQHGVANLNIAISKHELVIELDTPADNILGYEYIPKTEQQKQQLATSLSQLKQGDLLFNIPLHSECTLKQVKIDNPFVSHKMEHDEHEEHDEHDEHDESHTDFEALYIYNCQSPIITISFAGVFDHFPRLEKITAQWINEDKQSANVVTKETPTIDFNK